MNEFIISNNGYLSQDTQAYYHTDYTGFGRANNPNYINILKNIFGDERDNKLEAAAQELKDVLVQDLSLLHEQFSSCSPSQNFTVCVIPRSKTEKRFSEKQMLLRHIIGNVVDLNSFFTNGVHYIKRVKDTRTTHFKNGSHTSFLNDGEHPYRGITLDTCSISPEVQGENILLIDDVYTATINIVEDAIEALYDSGAQKVVFYAIGKTVYNRSY